MFNNDGLILLFNVLQNLHTSTFVASCLLKYLYMYLFKKRLIGKTRRYNVWTICSIHIYSVIFIHTHFNLLHFTSFDLTYVRSNSARVKYAIEISRKEGIFHSFSFIKEIHADSISLIIIRITLMNDNEQVICNLHVELCRADWSPFQPRPISLVDQTWPVCYGTI